MFLLMSYLKVYQKFKFDKTIESAENIEDNLEGLLKFYTKVGKKQEKYEEKQIKKKKKQVNQDVQETLINHIKRVLLKGEKIDFLTAIKEGNKEFTADRYFTQELMFKFLKFLSKKKVVSQRLGALIANLHTFKKDLLVFNKDLFSLCSN